MAQVRMQHSVRDYDAWKAMFDADPLGRAASGVRRFEVLRAVDDPAMVFIDLSFDTVEEARAMLARLEQLWAGPAAATIGQARATVVESVESAEL